MNQEVIAQSAIISFFNYILLNNLLVAGLTMNASIKVGQHIILKSIGGLLTISILFLSLQASAKPDAIGEDLYKKRCALCHALPDPAHVPPEGWEKRMEMMAPLAKLKKKQKAEVLQYLQDHIKTEIMEAVAVGDKALVEEKCSTCHTLGRVALQSFDGDDGRHVLERMQSYAGSDLISEDQMKLILNYLQNKNDLATVSLPLEEATPAQIFRVRCSACHALERVIKLIGADKAPDASWVHIVSRMQSKAPEWITPEESELLLSYIQSLENKTEVP
jgi:mono/diheme cytochrome c family protein